MSRSELVGMGVVGKAHGIKGELSCVWNGEFAPKPGMDIFIGPNAEAAKPYKLISSRWHKNRLLAVLDGMPDRNAAEKLGGEKIFLRKRDLPPLEEGEAWLADLPGSRILLDDGREIGVLDHFEFPAGQQLWVIKTGDGKEILFPARAEFIDSIDPANKIITILPPPGLLDIYLA